MKRLIPLVAMLLAVIGFVPSAPGDDVLVRLFPFTGEVRITNPNATMFTFVQYSLLSPGDALDPSPGVWKSISDVYDVSGNGDIDPANNWVKLSAMPDHLAEGVIPGPGGMLAPFRSVSLGQVWDSNATVIPDVTAQVTEPGGPANVIIDFAIDGDYYEDDVVDVLDYNLWRLTYGQSSSTLSQWADGNLNGIVDAADYTIWRNNVGLSLVGTPFETSIGTASSLNLSSGGIVPEPVSLALGLMATLYFVLTRRSR